MHNERYIEEDTHLKAYDSSLIKRLVIEVAPFMRYVVASLILLILTSLLALVGPYLIKIAIDVHIKNSDYSGLNRVVMIYFGVLILLYITEYLRIYYSQYIGQSVMCSLRKKVFAHILKLPISYFDKNPVGRVMTRVTNDIEVLSDMFTAGVITILGDFFMLAGIIGVLFYMNYSLALVTFIVIPILVAIILIFRKKLRASYRVTRENTAKLNSFLQENISGMKIVQLFARERAKYDDFYELNNEYKRSFFRTITAYSLFFPTIELISATAVALVIYYGGGEVIRQSLTIGALIAFIEYLRKFFLPIRDMTEKFNILQSAMSSAERVYKLMDTEIEESLPVTEADRQKMNGGIEFKDVSFAYDDENYVLKDISFKIAPGEKVAFVGATGAGKTSVVNLVSAFYSINKGRILIDGRDISSYPKETLRSGIGIVQQEAFIFSGSVKENISLHDDSVTMEEIEAAAKSAYASEFISKLPNGYDSSLGERGSRLSAGQKQLISFARVLIYDPGILILDEATSTVDPHTEYLIQKATEKLMEGRTSIIIAHRLSTIQNVDRIFVFHKGRLVETGTHDELYATGGCYSKLYDLQYKKFI